MRTLGESAGEYIINQSSWRETTTTNLFKRSPIDIRYTLGGIKNLEVSGYRYGGYRGSNKRKVLASLRDSFGWCKWNRA